MAEDVLQGCPDEKPPLREEVSTCLVNCLMQRFRVHGRVEDLRRIEELVLHDSARSIDNVHILGKLLITAFDWFRHQEFIDEAVKYSHLSVIAMSSTLKTRIPTPQDGIPEAEELEELTFAQAALQQLYNAEFAARYTQQSWWQEVLSPGSRMRPVNSWVEETSRLHDLGCAITKQFAVSPLRDNRQMSIALTVLRLAEQLAPRNSSQRWEYLFSLGTSHRVRHEIVQQPGWKDIKRAVELQSKAVEKLLVPNPRRIPALSSLACSLLQLAQASGDETQYYRAVDLLEHVADAFYGFIHDRLEGAILWASLLHSDTPFSFEDEQTQLQRALEGYKKAISLLARAVWIGLSTSSRLARLHSVPKTFASDAAACAIRLAELQSDPQRRQQYLGTAVELLDQGRAILWSQASQLHADLRLLSTRQPELAAELNGVAAELARTAFKDGNADSGNATADLAYKWDELVDRVRQLDGFHDFLRSTPFAALRQAAGPTTIIIVNVSEHRCDTIIIPSQGAVRLVPLPKLSKSQVDDNVQDIHSLLPSKDDRGEFETIAHDLWGDICQPVLAELREMGIVDQSPRSSGAAPHIRWCLTGRLAFLPIHAAGPRYQSRRKPGMLDWVTSSYISTLSMLLRAQQRREALQGQVPVPRVLAVCHSGGDERGRLPKAKEEVEILCSCLKPGAASVIMDNEARVDAVSDALKESNWVHFACHGTQNKTNPMDSALVLDDGRLPVSKLAEQNLKGEFAMLLACETAMGMPGLSDEAIHVAAGLHFAGFNSVGKYINIFSEKKEDGSPADALEAAQALRKALLFLRDKQKLSVRDWAPFMHFGL
ncbi:hypothetical protein EW026_g1122 [Hermanssonia centrifuga]|uniref:CHAT domain-containing protein n=1 Tax=Hermanssonia centrifuga TaxID=98765 RepID=A0A4S4KSG5_9APHY|nr:hypothetical protein EW026_g1122 [Hermanssonia centrifuga]